MEATQDAQTQQLSFDPAEVRTLDEPLQDGAFAELLPVNAKYRKLRLTKDETLLGRRSDCDMFFEEPKVSGYHCKVVRKLGDDGKTNLVFVEDLSSNGTFVNENKVGKNNRMLLNHGDFVSLLSPKISNKDDSINFVFKDLTRVHADEPQDEIYKEYDFGKELGRGNFGVVKMAFNRRSREAVAVKIIEKKKIRSSETVRKQIIREIELLKDMNHPNIVRYIATYEGPANLYIVLELVTGGELFDRVRNGRIAEDDARALFTEMLQAVKYLHEHKIVHRDIKPENLLLDNDGHVKIADFGLARVADPIMMTSLCGTMEYVAPEILKTAASDKATGYDMKVDMWSLGVVLFLMLTGQLPFDEEQRRRLVSVKKGAYLFPPNKFTHLSAAAKDMVSRLICVDPTSRYNSIDALGHNWITQASSLSQHPLQYLRRKRNVSPDIPIATLKLSQIKVLNPPTTSVHCAKKELCLFAFDDQIYLWAAIDEPYTNDSIQCLSLTDEDEGNQLRKSQGSREELYRDEEKSASRNLITCISSCDVWPRFFAVGTVKAKVILYQVEESGILLKQIYSEHTAPLRAIAWNEKFLATGGDDGMIYVHNVAIQDHRIMQWCLNDEVTHLAWAKSLNAVIAVGRNFSFTAWKVGEPSPIFLSSELDSVTRALAVCPWRNSLVALGDEEGNISFWDIVQKKKLLSHKVADTITALAFSPSGHLCVFSGAGSTTINTFRFTEDSTPKLELRSTFVVGECEAMAVSTTLNGDHTICICSDKKVRIWSLFGAHSDAMNSESQEDSSVASGKAKKPKKE